jgi:hypothetical protein
MFDLPSSMPQNVNRPESEGIEASFFVTLGWELAIHGVSTYLDVWICLTLIRCRGGRDSKGGKCQFLSIRPLHPKVALNVTEMRPGVAPIRFTNFDPSS